MARIGLASCCAILLTATLAASGCARSGKGANSETLVLTPATYHAVVLAQGQVFYAKVGPEQAGFFRLTDVYYIITPQSDPKSNAPKGSLIRRGKELHAPDQMLVNRDHILFFEPVFPTSRIGELIKEGQKENNPK